jgi:hypothetical protein
LIISIDTAQAVDKIQHPLMIKTLMKTGIGEMHLNIIKDIHYKVIASIILNGRKTETISSEVRNKAKVSMLSTLIQCSGRILSKNNKIGRRNKGI